MLFGEKSCKGEYREEEQRWRFRARNKKASRQYKQGAEQVGATDHRCLEKNRLWSAVFNTFNIRMKD